VVRVIHIHTCKHCAGSICLETRGLLYQAK
jgi:hypothetical protein